MIAPLRADSDRPRAAQSPEAFEAMLPTIRRVAAYAFRHAPRELREELVADVVAQAFLAFMNLVARGKAAWAYPTVLAKYAIWQMRDGRLPPERARCLVAAGSASSGVLRSAARRLPGARRLASTDRRLACYTGRDCGAAHGFPGLAQPAAAVPAAGGTAAGRGPYHGTGRTLLARERGPSQPVAAGTAPQLESISDRARTSLAPRVHPDRTLTESRQAASGQPTGSFF